MEEGWQEKAAGLMCVGLRADALTEETRLLIDKGVAGVVLLDQIWEGPDALAAAVYEIKSYAARKIFVALDLPGGRRGSSTGGGEAGLLALGPGFGSRLSAARLGELDDPELARSEGQNLGRILCAAGVDLTLGPMLNLRDRQMAEATGTACLGEAAAKVARLGAALIEGQQSEGVAAAGKYFPGLGQAPLRSPAGLPRISLGTDELEEKDLLPFKEGISCHMAGAVVGHTYLSALDSQLPASLSRGVLVGLLRQRLGFRGFVMTDDVDSVRLRAAHSAEQVASLGAQNGIDCFLCASRPASSLEMAASIARAVDSGVIMPERIEAARRRLAPLLHRYVKSASLPPTSVHDPRDLESGARPDQAKPSLH